MPVEERRALVSLDEALSVRRQCRLLGLDRSGLYYEPAGESAENLRLMRRLDELHTAPPFYGVRKMGAVLEREGCIVNRKRVRRLLRLMGLMSVAPRPSLSRPALGAQVFPYLLRGLAIGRAHQVWAIDITYIRLRGGFLYLSAVLDWWSRYVLAWELSNSLEVSFCVSCLRQAKERAGGVAEIINSDQGCQFTSREWIETVQGAGMRVSHDGKGRALDNVMIERLWRSVKVEEVYLHDYADGGEARQGLTSYFEFYNHQRPHQALAWRTPFEVIKGSPNNESKGEAMSLACRPSFDSQVLT
jgi:putative transposase